MADRADDDFNVGVAFWRRKHWSQAADAFELFLRENPEHKQVPLVTLYLGLTYNAQQKYEPARDQFIRFLKLEPDSSNAAAARYRLGESSFYLGDYAAAAKQLEEFVQRHPDDSLVDWGRLQLGESWIELGDWQPGETQLLQLIRSGVDDKIILRARYALARSKERQEYLDEAVSGFLEVAKSTNSVMASRALAKAGTIRFRQQSYPQAAALYDEILSRFPDSQLAASAALNSGLSWYRDENFENALNRFQRIPKGTPEATEAALLIGKSQARLGQLDAARQTLGVAFAVAASQKDRSQLAAEILFEQARVERQDGRYQRAAQIFIDLADRWPQDDYAAESLYNAASLRLELNEPQIAAQLLKRVQTDFPEAFAKPGIRVLEARILASRNEHEAARPILRTVADDQTSDQRSVAVALYYLARMEHDAQRFDSALATVEQLRPLLDSASNDDLRGALAVGALSALEADKPELAEQLASSYLATPSVSHAVDARAARAIAFARQKHYEDATNDIRVLIAEASDQPQTWQAVLQSAEHAWGNNEFETALRLFELTGHRDATPAVKESGASGAAWCLYQQKKFQESATAFDRVARDFDATEVGLESAYMKARSLHDGEHTEQAVVEYLHVFQEFAQRATSESDATLREHLLKYSLESGQLAARLLDELGRAEDAQQQWKALADRFAGHDQLDEILDEWAWRNLECEQYAASDKIYRRLIQDCPNSRFVGTARLSLAESDLSAERVDEAIKQFEEIVRGSRYGESEKEKAVYHLADIHAERRNWSDVVPLAERFAKNHSGSDLAPRMQLLHADALLNLNQPGDSRRILNLLRNGVVDGHLQPEPWTERIWVLLGELALAESRFEEIDSLATEFEMRFTAPQKQYQMHYVQGRRWKNQPEPQFDRAREHFDKVIYDESKVGRGTRTAARSQFLIGETYLLQEEYEKAANEYYKVYLLYRYPDLQARALFQAAGCHAALGDAEQSKTNYRSLVQEFPESEFAAQARQRLGE